MEVRATDRTHNVTLEAESPQAGSTKKERRSRRAAEHDGFQADGELDREAEVRFRRFTDEEEERLAPFERTALQHRTPSSSHRVTESSDAIEVRRPVRLQPELDRATRPTPHDNPAGAEARANARAIAEQAEIARQDARYYGVEGVEEDGTRVTVTSNGRMTTVTWDRPNGSRRVVDRSLEDPTYVRETRISSTGEEQIIEQSGNVLSSWSWTRDRTTSYELSPRYDTDLVERQYQGRIGEGSVPDRTLRLHPWGQTSVTDRFGNTVHTPGDYRMTAEESAYQEELMERYGFSPEARAYLRANVPLLMQDPSRPLGGGLAPVIHGPEGTVMPVWVRGRQDEAALHEMAHQWYEHLRQHRGMGEAQQQEFRDAVRRMSEDPNADAKLREIAGWFVANAAGNTSEQYASLSSGAMGDLNRFPPYLRQYFAGIFTPRASPTGEPTAHAAAHGFSCGCTGSA